ncbi:hypothetical protein ABPG77_007459 [Micractinium sp. CCAP 211/92]
MLLLACNFNQGGSPRSLSRILLAKSKMRSAARSLAPGLGLPARSLHASPAAATPMIMKATVEGYGEGASTLVTKDQFRFLVDEPVKLGGLGKGPNPLTFLLGSLVGCTQYTASMVAREMRLDPGAVAWKASGEYDLRGVRGNEPGVDARFRKITLSGTFDGQLSQEELDSIAQQVERRCIVAATLRASGMDMQLSMKNGDVDHDCEPACVLHEMDAQPTDGASTGQVKGQPSREADAPQFAGTGGRARPSARGYSTLAGRARSLFTTAATAQGKDGEDVAREHLKGTGSTPQLKKETSQEAGAPTTAGGAYASRDDPASQASQPTGGKSQEQIVQEQGAGSTVHPQNAGNAEGGAPLKQEGAHSPKYADRAVHSTEEGRSQLGDTPQGAE